MQPETAFWVLSSIAQSSAALAGLSALLWVYFMRSFKHEWQSYLFEKSRETGKIFKPFRIRIISGSSSATILFVLALGLSLATLTVVVPGSAPLPVFTLILTLGAIALVLFAGLMMVAFILTAQGVLEYVPDDSDE